MYGALACIPCDEVPRVFRRLESHLVEDLAPIYEYFGEYYVLGRPVRGRRKAVPLRYAPPVWNQYEAALAGDYKTNNLSESWLNRTCSPVKRVLEGTLPRGEYDGKTQRWKAGIIT